MKKILLIIAIVLCVAIAATALAVGFQNSPDVTGTLAADTYLALSFGDGFVNDSIDLTPGQFQYYTVRCNMTKSEHAPGGALTIHMTDATAESKDLDDIFVYVYSESTRDAESLLAERHGTSEGDIVLTLPTDQEYKIYYIAIRLDPDAASDDADDVGGTVSFSLDEVA